MDNQEFECYLRSRYEDQCRWYSSKATFNKQWYHYFQTAILGLSAVTTLTIAVGMYFQDNSWIRLVALTITATVTVLAGLLKVYRFQEQWIEYRDTAETLKKEKYLYKARIGEYAKADSPEQMFVDRVETLISRQNTLWVERRQTDE